MLTLKVLEKEIQIIKDEMLVRGTVGEMCKIMFDNCWAKYEKIVVFKSASIGSKGYEKFVIDMNAEIDIPWEVLKTSGYLKIGVYGADGADVSPTLWSDKIEIKDGTDTSGLQSAAATPSLIAQIASVAGEAMDIAQSVRDDADSGKFDGKDGKDGEDTGVGKSTEEGGEIFNDYNTNKALSAFATAKGSNNIAGGKCFKVIADPIDNGDGTGVYTLDSVEGLETDMRYSAFLETQSVDAGKILSINADTKEVAVDGFVYYPLNPNTDNPETFEIDNSFIITGRPDLGTTDIGFAAFVGGKNSFAQNSHVVTFGKGNYGLGKYATTFGINNISAYNATTLGQGNKNLGATSLVTGANNTATVNRVFVSGKNNTANGADSFIGGGQENVTKGEGSAAFNFGNKATGYGSVAFGLENEALGSLSFVAGQNNKPTGKRTAAFGRGNVVKGENAAAFGLENNIGENAANSVVFGEHNKMTGSHSLISGTNNNVASAASIASGHNNTLNSNGGCAFGRSNKVSGTQSGCIGNENTVNKSYSVALNSNNTVNGEKSLVIGSYNTVNGMHSFAGGNSCVIGENGKSTFCLGRVLKSDVPYQTVVGQYNNPNADALFVVGNGVDNASWGRKNAFEVYKDGSVSIGGVKITPEQLTKILVLISSIPTE